MALYEMTNDTFRQIEETSFSEIQVRERGDLQRLLRSQIDVLGDELYVLAEEFSDWEDSKRRVDLLAIDADANLVIIELKRTQDGGHMELQAIRYASMVSAMTFARAVKIHKEFLTQVGESPEEAEAHILEFLGWDEPDEETFAADVRMVLVSEDFGKELTTAVLWLREKDVDIRCIRLKPYRDANQTMVDVQQVIPLPEAHDYQVQLREKEQQGRKQKADRYEIRQRFWEGVVKEAKNTNGRHSQTTPGTYNWIGAGSGIRGLSLNYSVVQDRSQAELYIDRGEFKVNKHIFDALIEKKDEIEKVFGEGLTWERLDDRRASRIKYVVNTGGYRTPDSEWPLIHKELVSAMGRLEEALRPHVQSIQL
jgi:hypothetical protein